MLVLSLVYFYSTSFYVVVTDLYQEQHAKDALSAIGERSWTGFEEMVQTHAGCLYNSAIPIDRPKV